MSVSCGFSFDPERSSSQYSSQGHPAEFNYCRLGCFPRQCDLGPNLPFLWLTDFSFSLAYEITKLTTALSLPCPMSVFSAGQ